MLWLFVGPCSLLLHSHVSGEQKRPHLFPLAVLMGLVPEYPPGGVKKFCGEDEHVGTLDSGAKWLHTLQLQVLRKPAGGKDHLGAG